MIRKYSDSARNMQRGIGSSLVHTILIPAVLGQGTGCVKASILRMVVNDFYYDDDLGVFVVELVQPEEWIDDTIMEERK